MTNKKEEEILIDPNDFKSMVLNIDLTNITTQAEIRDGKRCYGKGISKHADEKVEEKLEILISEFLEDGLILEIPTKTCAATHTIMIEVHTVNTKPLVNFTATLKVDRLEKISLGSDMIET